MNNMFLSGTTEGPIWYTIPYQSTYWLLNRGEPSKKINQTVGFLNESLMWPTTS